MTAADHPLLDPFGSPITGAKVSWEQGTDCGLGDFCANGTATTMRTSGDGHARYDVQPVAGGDPLWRPQPLLGTALKSRPIVREGVADRVAEARASQPLLGILRVSGRAIVAVDLPDLVTARAMTAEARRRAEARGAPLAKDGPLCPTHSLTCPSDPAPVFRAVQLPLDSGDDIVDLQVRILDAGQPTETLDGYTVLAPIPLTLEVEATVRDDQGVERQVAITDPIALSLSDGAGGALSDGASTCALLDVAPGPFTYFNARESALHYAYDEPDGSPCCWQPTELLYATVVVDAEIDDGQGGTIRVRRQAETTVESTPRPADPCEIRPYPPGTFPGDVPQIAGPGPLSLMPGETSFSQWVGSAYVTDACGNISHLSATDPQLAVTGVTPFDPEVWAELEHPEHSWEWQIHLHSSHHDVNDRYSIPDGLYTVGLGIDRSAECGGGTAVYDQTVDYSGSRPVIQLKWVQSGQEPEPPMASPGSTLRHPATGEVIAWKVRPADSNTSWHGSTIYTDVPVRLYVAENLIYWDADSNVAEMFKKVDDAEICVGQVHWHHDPDAYPDPGWDVTTTTCDQLFTGETTVLAYTEPEWTSGPFDGYVGIAAGITRAPDHGGTYYLMAEPLDELFRQGDSWRIDTDFVMVLGDLRSHRGTYRKRFEVGGGVYLDENSIPIDHPIIVSQYPTESGSLNKAGTTIVLDRREISVLLFLDSAEATVLADVDLDWSGGPLNPKTIELQAVGSTVFGKRFFIGKIGVRRATAEPFVGIEEFAIPEEFGMGVLTTQAQGFDDPGLPEIVMMPEIRFVDQSPTYSLDAAAEQDSANFFLRENDDQLNLEIFYTLKPEILPVEDVEIRIYQENTVALAEPAIPGQLQAGGGGFETFGQLRVVWPDAREGGFFVGAGYFPVQLKVTYPNGAGAIETPIFDGDLDTPGWQCPDDGLAVHDLIWKHRPIVHIVEFVEIGPPTTIEEFMTVDASRLKEWLDGVPNPIGYNPLPASPPTSPDWYFDLFNDQVPSTGDLDFEFDGTHPPTGLPRLETLRTDPGQEALYHSAAHNGETADFVFLQYWMFENFSTGSFFTVPGAYPYVYHEGDVEYVQLTVPVAGDSNNKQDWLIPSAATASQHYYAQTLGWNKDDGGVAGQAHLQLHVEHDSNERFHVYIALGSHATYFSGDDQICMPCLPIWGVLGTDAFFKEDCSCFGPGWSYDVTAPWEIEPIDYRLLTLDGGDDQGWLSLFGGRWGFLDRDDPDANSNGPPGPPTRAAERESGDPDPVVLRDQPCRLHNLAIVRANEEPLRIDDCRQN